VTSTLERVETPEQAGDDQLAVLAKALGHPARIQVLRLLLARDLCFCGEMSIDSRSRRQPFPSI